MSGNSIGKNFVVSTFGESHGPALGCIIDGCPPGLSINSADIQKDLDLRKPGQSKYTTQRREDDEVEILSGVFEGKTTGTPIGLLIRNQDQRSRDYDKIKDRFRPGHADFTYHHKYGIRDYRGGGRSSARETAVRVAAGAIARQYLKQEYGVEIRACVDQIGTEKIAPVDWTSVHENAFFVADNTAVPRLEQLINDIRKAGDSIGAGIYAVASGVPVGWGEPIFDRLEADLAKAMLSINASRAVEFGAGFDCITQKGSEHRDLISQQGFLSNHAGGVLGGISSGQDVTLRVAFKPTSSIQIPGKTLDIEGNEVDIITTGRHDPCVGIRAVPIVEAMMALVLIDHALRQRAQNPL